MAPKLTPEGRKALDAIIARASTDPRTPGAFIFGLTTGAPDSDNDADVDSNKSVEDEHTRVSDGNDSDGGEGEDGEVYFNGSGNQIYSDPTSGSINADSVFWICSQSKMVTHLAALQLIENGLLSAETLVSEYIPQLKNPIVLSPSPTSSSNSTTPTASPGPSPHPTHPSTPSPDPSDENSNPQGAVGYHQARHPITIKHLLNMTSGLAYDTRPGDMPLSPERQLPIYAAEHGGTSGEGAVDEFLGMIKGDLPAIPLKSEPGADWTYGWSTDVLGFVIEKVSGMSLEEYMKQNIFTPLNMSSTSFYLTPDLAARQVQPTLRVSTYADSEDRFEPWNDRVRLFETDPSKVKRHLGGVGLYSTARDYLKLLRHILQIHAGTAKNPIFSLSTVHSLFTPALTSSAALKSLRDKRPEADWDPTPENGYIHHGHAHGHQHQHQHPSVNVTSAVKDSQTQTQTQTQTHNHPRSHQEVPDYGYQWSTALMLNTFDWEGMRRAGSGTWEGWSNTHHLIDPTASLAYVFNTQVIPPGDKTVYAMKRELERGVYAGLKLG